MKEEIYYIYATTTCARRDLYCRVWYVNLYIASIRIFMFDCSRIGSGMMEEKKQNGKGNEIEMRSRERMNVTINTEIGILFYKCWLLLNVEYCSAESSRAFVWEINLRLNICKLSSAFLSKTIKLKSFKHCLWLFREELGTNGLFLKWWVYFTHFSFIEYVMSSITLYLSLNIFGICT